MLEQVKINPCATMFSEIICKNSKATAIVSGSFENPASNSSGLQLHQDREPIITTVAISAALTKVSRTRGQLPAPKFWPAIGPAASETASAGIWIKPSTRVPMPNPACAAAPNRAARSRSPP